MIDWNNRWKEFLLGQGAVMDDTGVRHFAEPDAHAQNRSAANGDIVTDLSHLALIRAHGPEAAAFLQGQLSNDVNALGIGHSQLSAYCDPKGRVLALFRIFVREQAYYLQLPSVLQADTLQRLGMFVLRAKLTLDSASRDLIRIGLSGPNAEQFLADAVPDLPSRVDESRQHDDVNILRLAGPHARYELIATVESAERLWPLLGARAKAVGHSAWSWLDIAAGVPTVLPGTRAEFIPQMLNLDLLNGVSFQKGCYPGQEIVARVQHRGRVTHRLYTAHSDAAAAPPPGSPLYDAQSDQAAGWVVDAQPAPDRGGFDLSVVAPSQFSGALHLENGQGTRLTLQKPRYFPAVS